MHRFFELVSVGEEIIQEAKPKKPDFLARIGKGARSAYRKAGKAAGGAAEAVGKGGKSAYRFAGKKATAAGEQAGAGLSFVGKKAGKGMVAGGKFVAKHPKKFGAGALALGAGGAAAGGYKFAKKQESDLQEGKAGLLTGIGTSIGKFGGSVKRDIGTLGRLGKAGMKGKKGGIFNAASMMAGSRAGKRSLMRGGIGAAGIGGAAYGGSKLFGRQESELPELSASLQDAFLSQLTEGKAKLTTRVAAAASGGFKFAKKKATKAYAFGGEQAAAGGKWAKRNPGKVGLGALAVGGAAGAAGQKRFGK